MTVKELYLYTINDGALYKFVQSIAKKVESGEHTQKWVDKQFSTLAKLAVASYNREFGSFPISSNDKKALAAMLYNYYTEIVKLISV